MVYVEEENTDNTKIGIKRRKSYQKMKRSLDESTNKLKEHTQI
jgi:hypothetical protein